MTVVRPYAGTWDGIKAVFAALRPDLVGVVSAFGPLPPGAFARWLDSNFPHSGGGKWGPTDIKLVATELRKQMESAK